MFEVLVDYTVNGEEHQETFEGGNMLMSLSILGEVACKFESTLNWVQIQRVQD